MKAEKKYIGLTDDEVAKSRSKWGENVLTPPAKEPLWKLFLEKFKDPLILILLVAGVLSVGIACYEYWIQGDGTGVFFEPVGIFAAIILATGLSFYFEYRADCEFAILNQVNDEEPVKVIRNGGIVTAVPRREVVVGDIVVLDTGEEIPADAKLLEAIMLNVDESTLTGEPICHKSADPADADPEATFPTDCVMRGTKVMEGHGVAEVVAVGDATENGKVFEAAQIDNSVKTPLDEQLDRLGKLITKITYGIAALVVVGRVAMFFVESGGSFEVIDLVGYILSTIMIAVALIVVAVPEGLPMAVTLSLAYSMRRMLKTNNLVRKMHACETMGAATVICTDKTGTLTQNRMQVAEADFYGLADGALGDDRVSCLVKENVAVNSTAELDLSNPAKPVALGNPTEGALLLWLKAAGVDYRDLRGAAAVVESLPFSTERKYMATVVNHGAERVLYVKGAPEIVMGLCSAVDCGVTKDDVAAKLTVYQSKAMRTLGFAYKVLADGETPIADGRVVADGLTLLGVVAISDPVRDDVPAAVAECVDAGISIKIVTGDTIGTAGEIGRQIGLLSPDESIEHGVITGPDFAALSDEELHERIDDLKIIARARPLDKKRLVETLQQRGEVVAVTGDGTNDAPALKAAQVGLSMGDGTSVAKEASDITIVDNSFASIGRAVMWGRSLYKNIQRFVLFQLTVNVVACLIVLFGAFMGTESPLTVTQMLWVNLIMDTFAAMALASLPPSPRVMADAPRDRKSFIIDREMRWNIITTGGIFFVVLLGLLWVFEHSTISSTLQLLSPGIGAYNGLGGYELSLFFTTFVMLQFWNIFNAKAFSSHCSAFHFAHCSEFVVIACVILFGQLLIVTFGGEFFNVEPLALVDWVVIIAATSLVLWIGELRRLLDRN